MSAAITEQIQQHLDYQYLVRRKQRLTACMTAAVLFIYYGFALLLAFAPEFMAKPISTGLTSVGIVLAVIVIFLCFGLTAFFVHQSNQLDPLVGKIKRECT